MRHISDYAEGRAPDVKKGRRDAFYGASPAYQNVIRSFSEKA
ncbi:hypothetical protein BN137_3881 [Cronobacter condimenti 1330]|uniref:Uncharacterized protein n=1 Tax=Cronobacter condimenti 1330 TaxID=1073999 RepID=K8A3E7_9ENTR|nr:hypothetical protein BN137_3881 [Cronobacter condimenti 1330]